VRRHLRVAVVVLLMCLAVGGAAAYWWWQEALAPVRSADTTEYTVQIPRGASTRAVAQLLYAQGLIRSELAFRLYARLNGLDGRLQAGEYRFRPAEDVPTILRRLVEGDVVTYAFTIPEGYRVEQIVDLLVTLGYADRERLEEVLQDISYIEPYFAGDARVKQPLEGFLFPDTYRLTGDTSEEELVSAMVRRFKQVFTPEWEQRAAELGMSVYEVVTLASIIEKEARKPEERPIIAAVYHNRLRRGMKLDADPTVQYGLGKFEPLLYADLKIDTPYNTYLHPGLPPGPIANPGRDSLYAALYPADVDYLYFVACSDDGAHAFARTLKEQLRNIRRCRDK